MPGYQLLQRSVIYPGNPLGAAGRSFLQELRSFAVVGMPATHYTDGWAASVGAPAASGAAFVYAGICIAQGIGDQDKDASSPSLQCVLLA